IELRAARWPATRAPRRGTVCVFPGRTEPIEKYFEVVADLRRRGFAVAVLDWRGQGGSSRLLADPAKGHVRSFKDYDRDLAAFMREVVLPDCPPPYYALAHSMGGNILLRTAARGASWFDRMVLVAPMLAINQARTPVNLSVARFGVEVLGTLGLAQAMIPGGHRVPEEMRNGFEDNPFTTDRERFMRYRKVLEVSPSLGIGSPTLGWVRAAGRSMAWLARPDVVRAIQVPILFISAGDERIVSTPAVERLASRLKLAAYVTVPLARHEVLMERDEHRARFWAAFDAYLGVTAAAA
ncbi:MAG TPA: alpha/beta hydrolase, partial [Hyphomicrobiaceae bacterium]|nr:alpha/beta hydrolase [Hyphomicrobiaceae bacterium]